MKRVRFLKRAAAKLKASAGESLAEVLVSMLIAALALTMLASVIASTAKIITQNKAKMSSYYSGNEKIALQDTSAYDGRVDFHLVERISGSTSFTTGDSKYLIGSGSDSVQYYINYELGGRAAVVAYRVNAGSTSANSDSISESGGVMP